MSTTALKDFESAIRQQLSHEGREPVGEDRVTLLKIRQIVAEYNLSQTERQADLDKLIEEGEYEGSYAYDSQLSENETGAAGDLRALLSELAELLP
ncbi:hypothetical protein PV708_02500 [Streptomyces sp. ME02-6977A]|uniref:hypothetical protein n=1 Tax=Streptomyces sp. ME02-6977A TaxID=3028671 RepID=UPI0029BF0245|nr:hypothetical protein [Streptomyces sp. ME02-6977A]MDX3405118.1 hypothetical protein [Streptomyces sp. ME02-6977A]